MSSSTDVVEAKESKIPNSPLPARKMHHIVLGMVGLLFLIAATYPLGMYRITQQENGWGEKVKVKGAYVKTLDDAKQPVENK
jgi:hypothetical protein